MQAIFKMVKMECPAKLIGWIDSSMSQILENAVHNEADRTRVVTVAKEAARVAFAKGGHAAVRYDCLGATMTMGPGNSSEGHFTKVVVLVENRTLTPTQVAQISCRCRDAIDIYWALICGDDNNSAFDCLRIGYDKLTTDRRAYVDSRIIGTSTKKGCALLTALLKDQLSEGLVTVTTLKQDKCPYDGRAFFTKWGQTYNIIVPKEHPDLAGLEAATQLSGSARAQALKQEHPTASSYLRAVRRAKDPPVDRTFLPLRVLVALDQKKRQLMREYLEAIVVHMGFQQCEPILIKPREENPLMVEVECIVTTVNTVLKRNKDFVNKHGSYYKRFDAAIDIAKAKKSAAAETIFGEDNDLDAFLSELIWDPTEGAMFAQTKLTALRDALVASRTKVADSINSSLDEKTIAGCIKDLEGSLDALKHAHKFLETDNRNTKTRNVLRILCAAKRLEEGTDLEKWSIEEAAREVQKSDGVGLGHVAPDHKARDGMTKAFALIKRMGFSGPFDTDAQPVLHKQLAPAVKTLFVTAGEKRLGQPQKIAEKWLKEAGLALTLSGRANHDQKCKLDMRWEYPSIGDQDKKWNDFWGLVLACDDYDLD